MPFRTPSRTPSHFRLLSTFPVMFLLVTCLVSACSLTSTVPSNQATPTTNTIISQITNQITSAPILTPTFTITPQPSATTAPPTSTRIPAGATLANCSPRADWSLIYTVVSGDTLGKIAQTVGSSIAALQQGNCLVDANQIVVGQKLRVPSMPPTVAPTTSTGGTNPVGGVELSEIISGDAGVVYLLRDSTITVTWTNAPIGLANVSFVLVGANYPNGTDTTIHQVVGQLTNPTSPITLSWKVPAGLKGENLVAQGQYRDSMYLYYSLPITVNSAPPAGQGCQISPSSGRVSLYFQPDVNSGVFGVIDPGQFVEVLGRSLSGWYGIDPGVTQTGGSISVAGLRWLPPEPSYVKQGSC